MDVGTGAPTTRPAIGERFVAVIIVTGATGFIGSNLLADLNESGVRDIILIDELGSEHKWKNIAKHGFQDIVNPAGLEALLGKLSGCEVVYHMGANSSTTATDGDAILRTNFGASKTLWEWCAATRTPLIYASSAATYGDGTRGFEDDQSPAALAALMPLNLYGWSKHAFDRWAVAQTLAPPQWCGLKFFNVYGPNEAHKGDMRSLVSKNTGAIAAGRPIKLFKSHRSDFADGQQLRDFVYVKDCTRVMRWLASQPKVSGIFNMGTGVARSFVDLMNAIGEALGTCVNIDFVDMPEAIQGSYQYYTKAMMNKLAATGYSQPFHSLEEGVRDYVRQYLMQKDPYR